MVGPPMMMGSPDMMIEPPIIMENKQKKKNLDTSNKKLNTMYEKED